MDECFIGMVVLFAADWTPDGWLQCHGQTLNVAEYTSLYSLFATTFGGNGTTTFALPDLRSVAPTGMTYIICTDGPYPLRAGA